MERRDQKQIRVHIKIPLTSRSAVHPRELSTSHFAKEITHDV